MTVHVLAGGADAPSERSALLPALDLTELASFVTEQHPSASVRTYRAALRAKG